MTVVDADTRDRWIAETAERTLERIEGGGMSAEADDVYGERDYRQIVTEALENLE
jgi:RPA family protein